MDNTELIKTAELFCIDGRVSSIDRIGNGHINDTYLVCTSRCKYVLQRINTNVFMDPDGLMENVVAVTEHLRGLLRYIPARPGDAYYVRTGEGCFRMMNYIDNSYSCEVSDDPGIFYEIAKAYGSFISDLADFPAGSLHETIRNFHNTRKRFDALIEAARSDVCGRRSSAQDEIRFAMEHERDVDLLSSPAANGELPLRVIHNDTKINNVMLDRTSDKALCVIDLDTVMPGSAVTDFGDMVRSCVSTGREDEPDAGSIKLDLDIYRSLKRGFLEGFPQMTAAEMRLLPAGAKLMTLECGIRFLTDHLEGDHYFRTDYPGHNLARCRTQFSLLNDIEEKWQELQNRV